MYHEHESIPLPIEDEPVEKTTPKPTIVYNVPPAEDADKQEPEKLVRKKRVGFRLPGQQNISFFRKQKSTRKIRVNLHWSNEQIISFITAVLLLGSLGGTIYYNEVIVSKVPRLEYE